MSQVDQIAHDELKRIADRLASALQDWGVSHPAIRDLEKWRAKHEPWIAHMPGEGERTKLDEL